MRFRHLWVNWTTVFVLQTRQQQQVDDETGATDLGLVVLSRVEDKRFVYCLGR